METLCVVVICAARAVAETLASHKPGKGSDENSSILPCALRASLCGK